MHDTTYFLDWMNNSLQAGYLEKAKDILIKAENTVETLKDYRTTPQSAPWHVEGLFVSDHIERGLAGLEAVIDGASLLDIEELARHKELQAEVIELQEIIQENAATLRAFMLLHDIGKTITLSFDAESGSRGEKEGFVQHKHRGQIEATKQERALYQKLYKAFSATHQDLEEQELMAKFYDEYEIKTHFHDHARVGASHDFFDTREAICNLYRLTTHDRAVLTFLIRNHIDALSAFQKGVNVSEFNLLTARANKAGFDADDVLDLVLAAQFLDSSVGSVSYRSGVFSADITTIVNFLLSEEQAAPARRVVRRDKSVLKERRKMKDVLAQADLTPDEIFGILGTPVGSDRGRIMKHVYDLIVGTETEMEFGVHNSTLAPRIHKAQKLFDQLSSS